MIVSFLFLFIFSQLDLESLSPKGVFTDQTHETNLSYFTESASHASKKKQLWKHFKLHSSHSHAKPSPQNSRLSQIKNRFLEVEDTSQLSRTRKSWLFFKAVYRIKNNSIFATLILIYFTFVFLFFTVFNFIFDLHYSHLLVGFPIHLIFAVLTFSGIFSFVLYFIPGIIESIFLKIYRFFRDFKNKKKPSFLSIISTILFTIALLIEMASWIAVRSGSEFFFTDMLVGLSFEFIVLAFIKSILKSLKKRHQKKLSAQTPHLHKKVSFSFNGQYQSHSLYELSQMFNQKQEGDVFLLTLNNATLHGFSAEFISSPFPVTLHHQGLSTPLKKGDFIPRGAFLEGHDIQVHLKENFIQTVNLDPPHHHDLSHRYIHIFEIIFFVIVLIIAFSLILYSLSSHTFISIPPPPEYTHSLSEPVTHAPTSEIPKEISHSAQETTHSIPSSEEDTSIMSAQHGLFEVRPGYTLFQGNRFSESFFFSSYLAVNFIIILISVGSLPIIMRYLSSRHKKVYIKNSNSLIPPHCTLFDLQSTFFDPFSPSQFRYHQSFKEESLFLLAHWAFTYDSEMALRMRNYIRLHFPDLSKKFSSTSSHKIDMLPSSLQFESFQKLPFSITQSLLTQVPQLSPDTYVLYHPSTQRIFMSCSIQFQTLRHDVLHELNHSIAPLFQNTNFTSDKNYKKNLGQLFFKSDTNTSLTSFPLFITDENHIHPTLQSSFYGSSIPVITGLSYSDRIKFIRFIKKYNNHFLKNLYTYIKVHQKNILSFAEVEEFIQKNDNWFQYYQNPTQTSSSYHVAYFGSTIEDVPILQEVGDYSLGFSSSIIHKEVEDHCAVIFRSQSPSFRGYYSLFHSQKRFISLVIFLFLFSIAFALSEALLIFLFQHPVFSHLMNGIMEIGITLLMFIIFFILFIHTKYFDSRKKTTSLNNQELDFESLQNSISHSFPDHNTQFLANTINSSNSFDFAIQNNHLLCLDVSIYNKSTREKAHYLFPIPSSKYSSRYTLTLDSQAIVPLHITYNKFQSHALSQAPYLIVSSSVSLIHLNNNDDDPSVPQLLHFRQTDSLIDSRQSSLSLPPLLQFDIPLQPHFPIDNIDEDEQLYSA